MVKLWQIFWNGVVRENPIFRLALSLCSSLAVTTTAVSAAGMGAAVIFVATLSNFVISLFRNMVEPQVRVPVFITIIATFVTMTQMLFEAFLPLINKTLGIYLPLVVVNCIILARAEMFASKNTVLPSIMDGLGMGCGYAAAILVIGIIRELFGFGTVFGFQIMGSWYSPPLIIILPPGAFILLGLIMGLINMYNETA